MVGYPVGGGFHEMIDGKQYTVTTCQCGRKWKKRTSRLPKLVPMDDKPFYCPKCGNKVADRTAYY